MRWIAAVAVMSVPAVAQAQDWVTRQGDLLLDPAGLQAALIEQDIVFYDRGRSEYFSDGRYAYTYDGGGTAHGTYSIREDSTVCVDFDNGFSRCDLFVRDGQRLVLITEKGERFPIRP